MQKLKCIIIDDEPLARKLLSDYCSRVPFLDLVTNFSNGLEALTFLRNNSVDFVFVDIKMPDISGLDLVTVLGNSTKVIFTTAFAEHAIDGFNLDAVDYLLKPFDFSRFLKAVNKVNQIRTSSALENSNDSQKYILVKDGRELVKLYFEDIYYIKGQKDYVQFQLNDRKVLSLMNLKDLETELPASDFIRIHQSFIINMRHLISISNDKVKLGDEFIPISQSYRLRFKAFLEKR